MKLAHWLDVPVSRLDLLIALAAFMLGLELRRAVDAVRDMAKRRKDGR